MSVWPFYSTHLKYLLLTSQFGTKKIQEKHALFARFYFPLPSGKGSESNNRSNEGMFPRQRAWYDTEEEHYLLLFSVAVCGLRIISFSLEHCWRPLEAGGAAQLFWLLSYSFYHPLFYNGPIITFKDYTQQVIQGAFGAYWSLRVMSTPHSFRGV